MKKILFILCMIFMCASIRAQTETMNWYVEGALYDTTTCESGGDIDLPAITPTKRGYTFQGWWTYTQLEYLESTGTQYIDTGTIGTLNTEYEITFLPVLHNGNMAVFGARRSSSYGNIETKMWQNYITNDFGDTSTRQDQMLPNLNGKITVTNSKLKRIVYDWHDNETYTNTTTYNKTFDTPNLYIGFAEALIGLTGTVNFQGKIYSCKIYDNNTLVRDFVPVLDYNGVPCMFDKVTETFFYNKGTGDFIAGPVVAEE